LGDAIDLHFILNRKFGLRKEDETLPERFQNEPLKQGPTKVSMVNIQRMVDEYYEIHGWEMDASNIVGKFSFFKGKRVD